MSLRAEAERGLAVAEALPPGERQLDLWVRADARGARAGATLGVKLNPFVSGFAEVAAKLDRKPEVTGLAGLRVRW